jgi:hypothetical protein
VIIFLTYKSPNDHLRWFEPQIAHILSLPLIFIKTPNTSDKDGRFHPTTWSTTTQGAGGMESPME